MARPRRAEPASWAVQQRTADARKLLQGAARLDARPLLVQAQMTPALLALQARRPHPRSDKPGGGGVQGASAMCRRG